MYKIPGERDGEWKERERLIFGSSQNNTYPTNWSPFTLLLGSLFILKPIFCSFRELNYSAVGPWRAFQSRYSPPIYDHRLKSWPYDPIKIIRKLIFSLNWKNKKGPPSKRTSGWDWNQPIFPRKRRLAALF